MVGNSTDSQIKYVALGDSLSAGVGSNNFENTIVNDFAVGLSRNGNSVHVLNLAVPGATTRDVIVSQLDNAVALNPDYITLFIGINDIHNKVSPEVFKSNYSHIIEMLLASTEAKITVINLPYLGSSSLVLPPYNWLLNSRTKQFNKVISLQADSSRITTVDLYSNSYEIFKRDQSLYSTDDFHPSEAGYAVWSQIIMSR